jgi:hypothetical protein
MKFGYIIGPFRAATSWQVEQNVRNAEALAHEVANLGVFPIIPHANTRFFNGLFTDEFWIEGTRGLMLRAADCAITVAALGFPWKHSVGSVAEVEGMRLAGRPVFHTVVDLSNWLTRAPVDFETCPANDRAEMALREQRRLCEYAGVSANVFDRLWACALQYGRACADISVADYQARLRREAYADAKRT